MFHIHKDKRWQVRGLYAYYECKCGARRTRRYVINLGGPQEPDFPPLVDRHGRGIMDSGWKRV